MSVRSRTGQGKKAEDAIAIHLSKLTAGSKLESLARIANSPGCSVAIADKLSRGLRIFEEEVVVLGDARTWCL